MTDEQMNILVIGSGGREHALCWKIGQSPLVRALYCAPGNGGTGGVAQNVSLDIDNHAAVIAFCREKNIGLVVIGPEAPLVKGLSDDLRAAGILAFGPSAAAAQLEGSKGFTKAICSEANIPTAAYAHFDTAALAHDYLNQQDMPIVIKADGLAAGKGVIIAETAEQAHNAIDLIFEGGFGAAGASVVIEAFMVGEEASFFVLTDGVNAVPMATAQDHKRVGEGDTGPNTGGMGAYSPAAIMTPALIEQTMTEIITPTLRTLAARGTPYQGVLYAGLMLTDEGPKLVEYNARFGDPECQVLMMRLASDIVPALIATAQGDLSKLTLNWHADYAVTVVMAAQGYPGAYEKGSVISGLDAAEADGAQVFHAGTQLDGDKITATGGRVLNVTARGTSIIEAQAASYAALTKINWPEGFFRSDIGWREIQRHNAD